MAKEDAQSALDRFLGGLRDRFGEGREDYTRAFYSAREAQGLDPEGTRIATTLGTNPSVTTARDLMGQSDGAQRKMREEMGMGLSSNTATRAGQVTGTILNDLTQDHTRSLWWLLNAPQATANVINEAVLAANQPELYTREPVKNKTGNEMRMPAVEFDAKSGRYKAKEFRDGEVTKTNQERYRQAKDAKLISESGVLRKGVNVKDGILHKRKYNPGDVAALGIAPGVAINMGLGLMTPFGGYEGYEAAVPDAEDPSKTANVLAEIGAKYILGRTGNLLPYSEFSEVRPDVSQGEYNRYKAFKYDKELDYDASDGDVNLLPMGILKATADGIHGAEVQFLGRSLPVNTAIIPYAGSVIGGALGVRGGKPIRGGLMGGGAGLAVGSVIGNLLEAERRRRNTAANEIDPENSLVI